LGLLYSFFAGCFGGLMALFMKRSQEKHGSSSNFLYIQYAISFLIALIISYFNGESFLFTPSFTIAACVIGSFLGLLMITTAKAIETGPSSIIFAVLYSSSVVPPLFLFVFFGPSFGFNYSGWNVFGSSLVVVGLLWASWSSYSDESRIKKTKKASWIFWVIISFIFQFSFLFGMQWRALHIYNNDRNSSLMLSISTNEAASGIFLPLVTISAAFICLIAAFIKKSQKKFNQELSCGIYGGLFNGISLFFLMLAAEIANSFEKLIILQVAAIVSIITCNIWGFRIYKEKVNVYANIVCILGVLLSQIGEILNQYF
jgi:hypothetical protein